MTPRKAPGWFQCTGCSGKHELGGGKGDPWVTHQGTAGA